MEQRNLYYFETVQMTSQALSKFTENTRRFLWFQNSIDQAVS